MDQRQHSRYPVRFHSSFSSVNLIAGDGIVVDLSLRGCCILSALDILPGTTLELRIYTSDSGAPLAVEQAVVRWCREGRVGLEFLSLQPGEWARLQDLVKSLNRQPYERTSDAQEGADI
jgi:hypothetical protein